VTIAAATGYGAAWLRGWPAARLRRDAAWALPVTAVWLFAAALRGPRWQAVALTPGHDWERGWSHLTVPGVIRTFLLVARPRSRPGWSWPRWRGRGGTLP
jgi:hypothetical protein